MLERKVYSAWAGNKDEEEMSRINTLLYNELKHKAKVEIVGTGYASKCYKVVDNSEHLTMDQLALICDKGNLCYGYRVQGSLIVIYTD